MPRPGRLKHSIPAVALLLEIDDLGLRDSLCDLHPGLWRDLVVVVQAVAEETRGKGSVDCKNGM